MSGAYPPNEWDIEPYGEPSPCAFCGGPTTIYDEDNRVWIHAGCRDEWLADRAAHIEDTRERDL